MFDRVEVKYDSSNQPYLALLAYSGYGEYNPGYYIKPNDGNETYTIMDSAYQI